MELSDIWVPKKFDPMSISKSFIEVELFRLIHFRMFLYIVQSFELYTYPRGAMGVWLFRLTNQHLCLFLQTHFISEQ